MTSSFAIDLQDVRKVFRGKVHALRGIDMQVHRGEVFGLLGPNGAGKSTLVRILMTIVRATRCHGTLLGKPVGDRGTLAQVGYLPEHLRFPDYLTAAQVLDYFAALAKVPKETRKQRIDAMLDLVGMTDWRNAKVKTFSKGMKQRIGLAQALMNDPQLILLDEPTDGVDPVGRREIRNLLLHMKQQGKTVFVNSHMLGELEMVCDRVAIMSQGAVVRQGSLEELRRDQRHIDIEAIPPSEVWKPEMDAAVASLIEQLHASVTREPHRIKLRVNDGDPRVIQPLIDALRQAEVVITAIRPAHLSLEDLFMQSVVDPSTGKAAAPGALRGKAAKEAPTQGGA